MIHAIDKEDTLNLSKREPVYHFPQVIKFTMVHMYFKVDRA